MTRAYLGIGSNIRDKQANCEEAVRRLQEKKGIEVISRSLFYRTHPVGGPPQEDFINGVLEVETELPPEGLLEALKSIEKEMGREPAEKDHPRIIDLDILLYNGLVAESEVLVIPHPRMHERSFVLKGLAELAPDMIHPMLGRTIRELYEEAEKEE